MESVDDVRPGWAETSQCPRDHPPHVGAVSHTKLERLDAGVRKLLVEVARVVELEHGDVVASRHEPGREADQLPLGAAVAERSDQEGDVHGRAGLESRAFPERAHPSRP